MLIYNHSVAFRSRGFKQMQMKVISDAEAQHRSRHFQYTGWPFLNGRVSSHQWSCLYFQSCRSLTFRTLLCISLIAQISATLYQKPIPWSSSCPQFKIFYKGAECIWWIQIICDIYLCHNIFRIVNSHRPERVCFLSMLNAPYRCWFTHCMHIVAYHIFFTLGATSVNILNAAIYLRREAVCRVFFMQRRKVIIYFPSDVAVCLCIIEGLCCFCVM